MANKTMSNLQKVTRVSNLKEATTISNGDVLLVETATETLKVTKGNLLKEVNEELNAKSDANHTHDEYVTESELNSKGLATEMFVTNKIAEAQLGNDGGNMDLSGYATTEYVDQEVGKTNAQLSQKQNHIDGLLNLENNIETDSIKLNDVEVELNNKLINVGRLQTSNVSFKNGKLKIQEGKLFSNGYFSLKNVKITEDTLKGYTIDANIVNIQDCVFENVAFQFINAKNIHISNCTFNVTVDNSTEIVGSVEFIHVVNSGNVLQNCTIDGNYFSNSKNDCIDVFPTGWNTSITNNTFDNCHKGLELKSHKRVDGATDGRSLFKIAGTRVSGNRFRNIPNGTLCIKHYATDEIDDTDFSLSPHITYSDNVFVNDNGVKYVGFYFSNIENVFINNCSSELDEFSQDSNFILLNKSSVYISNSYSMCAKFIGTTTTTTNAEARISNCRGVRVSGIHCLYVDNSEFERIFHKENGVYFINNTKLNETYTFYNGVNLFSNCDLKQIYNNVTAPSVDTFASFSNCIIRGHYSQNTEFYTTTNCKTVTTLI